jgi:hypothetical protein
MVKTKKFKEEGQVIEVEEEKVPVIEITQNQAKKLTKKPLSEKQQANIDKLIEANRQKWALKKAQLEEKKAEESEKKVKVVVKPKRIYPPRSKKVEEVYESDSATEESEEEEVEPTYQKPKPRKVIKKKQSDEIKNKLEQIETKLKDSQPINTVGFRFFNR